MELFVLIIYIASEERTLYIAEGNMEYNPIERMQYITYPIEYKCTTYIHICAGKLSALVASTNHVI